MASDFIREQPRDHRSHLGIPPLSLTSQIKQFISLKTSPPKASLNVCSQLWLSAAHLGHLQQLLLTSPSASLSIHMPHGFHGNSIETPSCSISSYCIYAQNLFWVPAALWRKALVPHLPFPSFQQPPSPRVPLKCFHVWEEQASKFSKHFRVPLMYRGTHTDLSSKVPASVASLTSFSVTHLHSGHFPEPLVFLTQPLPPQMLFFLAELQPFLTLCVLKYKSHERLV